jgi:uncharacterized protein
MQYIERALTSRIRSSITPGKVVILYGPRQVGKTTLAKMLLAEVPEPERLFISGDDPGAKQTFQGASLASLKELCMGKKRIVVDEAQRFQNIGLTLKLMVDNIEGLEIIATGSSSFDLASQLKEPLTGRSREFLLLPFSQAELHGNTFTTPIDWPNQVEKSLVFGSYPVTLEPSSQLPRDLQTLAEQYAYKDVLEMAEVREQEVLPRLLQALALQIGQEVSYSELANLLEVRKETVRRYITLLEQAFIIYRLQPLSSNERKLLGGRKRKIYFYDLGIRNGLLRNFNATSLRSDVGHLWENFCINERIKMGQLLDIEPHRHYWRSPTNEVDLVEEIGGEISAFECKYQKEAKLPAEFIKQFPDASFTVLNQSSAYAVFTISQPDGLSVAN